MVDGYQHHITLVRDPSWCDQCQSYNPCLTTSESLCSSEKPIIVAPSNNEKILTNYRMQVFPILPV